MTTPATPAADAVREAPPISEAIARYLRVCRSGGMPRRYVDIVQLAIEDAERLGYFNGLALARESALVAERDALRAALLRIIAVDDAHATIHAPDGDDVARMIEWAAAFDAARALAAPAVEG